MAGRGRGRGRGMTFDPREMGFGTGEPLPGPVLQPPPTYPPLDHRPVPMQTTPEMDYMIAVKKDLSTHLKDHWTELLSRSTWEQCFDYRRMPAELKMAMTVFKGKKRPTTTATVRSKKPLVDINALDALEKLDEATDDPEKMKEEEEEKEEGNEDEDLEEDVDEEMDDGTDYVNNYFDNGENYFDDDDDNGNDGPVY